MDGKFYRYPDFLAKMCRALKDSAILKETCFEKRSIMALKKLEFTLHYEFGSLLTMLDRDKFLLPLMKYCYPEDGYSNSLHNGAFSEVRLFDYYKKGDDKKKWTQFNLVSNSDFELDIAINIDNGFFIDIEIKHNEQFNKTVLGQMYRKCAFILSPYQMGKYGDAGHLFIAWQKKVIQKSEYFIRKNNCNYYVLTESLKKITNDGILEKSKDKSDSFKGLVKRFVESDGIRLITWESLKECVEKIILPQNNSNCSIKQSCEDFILNIENYYKV